MEKRRIRIWMLTRSQIDSNNGPILRLLLAVLVLTVLIARRRGGIGGWLVGDHLAEGEQGQES